MAKPTDLDALAQRYLDLWQDQLADMAADRDVAEIMARTVELMSSGTAALAAMAQEARSGPQRQAKGGGAGPENSDTRDESRTAAGNGDGTEAAAPAHRAADPGLDDLARRLAALEQRVASLEAGDGGQRPGPKGRPRKRRS